jgi:hypothetical protein
MAAGTVREVFFFSDSHAREKKKKKQKKKSPYLTWRANHL